MAGRSCSRRLSEARPRSSPRSRALRAVRAHRMVRRAGSSNAWAAPSPGALADLVMMAARRHTYPASWEVAIATLAAFAGRMGWPPRNRSAVMRPKRRSAQVLSMGRKHRGPGACRALYFALESFLSPESSGGGAASSRHSFQPGRSQAAPWWRAQEPWSAARRANLPASNSGALVALERPAVVVVLATEGEEDVLSLPVSKTSNVERQGDRLTSGQPIGNSALGNAQPGTTGGPGS
jgi:hypothetical protein